MKTINNFILGSILTALFSQCTSTKTIQNNLNAEKFSLAYLKSTKNIEKKNHIKVSLDKLVLDTSKISENTKVTKINGWVIPLLIVNVWKSVNNCKQGKSMFREDINDFLKSSLIEESKRSGQYEYDTLTKSDYQIEMVIDTIKTEGPYVSTGVFYFAIYAYGYVYSDYAGPAKSTLVVTFNLKNKGENVCSKTIKSESMTNPIHKGYGGIRDLQRNYAISMVESMSNNIKNVIENIVIDLNTYFEQKL